jgi:hypothetical protein
MRYLFVLALFVLGILMLGGQHTHDSYEVYGVAKKNHDHDYADSSHDHCGFTSIPGCGFVYGHNH